MSKEEYSRYESQELKLWKLLSGDEQFSRVDELTKDFEEEVKLIHVRHQAIKVELSVPKDEIYTVLVKYETYLREKLNHIPIIILLQEKLDANKRRK